MKKILNNYKETFVNYMMRTAKNKLYAIILFVVGLLSLPVTDDGTCLVVCLLMGSALFFTRENIFERN